MANQFIKERQLNSRGGLANAPQGRSIALSQPDGTKYRNASRLLNDLGMMLPGVMDKQQERADLEAQNAYKKAQLASAGKSTEEQAKALREARESVQSGEGRSFFDKMFVNEDKAVQVWDDLQGNTLIKDSRAKANRLRAENPHMPEGKLKQAIAGIYQEGYAKASQLSERVGNKFTEGTNEFLDKLDLEITNQYAEQRRQQFGADIIKDTHSSLNETVSESFYELDSDILMSGASDLKSYSTINETLKKEGAIDHIVEEAIPALNKQVSNMVDGNLIDRKGAHLKKLDTAYTFAKRVNSIEVLDKLGSHEDSSGMSMRKANPELFAEMRTKLSRELESRARTMKATAELAKSEGLKQHATHLSANYESKKAKATGANATTEDQTALSTYVNETRVANQEAWDNKTISADQYERTVQQVRSWEADKIAGQYISRPEAVLEATKRLLSIESELRGESWDYALSDEDVQWFNQNAPHMKPEQAKQFQKHADKLFKSKDRAESIKQAADNKLYTGHLNGLKMGSVPFVTSKLNEAELNAMNKMTPDLAKQLGVPMPPLVNAEQMDMDATAIGKGYLPAFTREGKATDYKPFWDKSWEQVTDAKKAEVDEWLETYRKAKEASKGAVEEDGLEDIEDTDDLTKAISSTISSFGADAEQWKDTDFERFNKEIIPSVHRNLVERNDRGDFKKTSDMFKAIDEMIPDLGEGSKKRLYESAVTGIWQKKLDRDQEIRDKEGLQMGDRFEVKELLPGDDKDFLMNQLDATMNPLLKRPPLETSFNYTPRTPVNKGENVANIADKEKNSITKTDLPVEGAKLIPKSEIPKEMRPYVTKVWRDPSGDLHYNLRSGLTQLELEKVMQIKK